MKLSIYKASAGSGKTHILAGKYIVEAFGRKAPSRAGTAAYEAFGDTMAFARILAVTFTNKAAGEMKERILKELDKLASGQESDYIAEILKRYPKYTEQQARDRARAIRSAILHNYGDFSLKTIDAFVQRVVRAFCYDINVSTGFTTQTDEKMVLDDLLDMLLKKSDSDPELRRILQEITKRNVSDGNGWDFRPQVKTLSRLIFTEQFKQLEASQKKNSEESRRASCEALLEEITEIYSQYEQEAGRIAQEAGRIFDAIDIAPAEIGRSMGTLAKFLKSGVILCDVKTAIADLASGKGWMNAKPTPNQKQYVPDLRPKLEPLLHQAIGLVEKSGTDYLTAKAIRKNFHEFRLLGYMAGLLPEYRAENRMMLISDATQFLNDIVAGNDAPFIYERVGNRFDHIFIDEFQDTSEFQWNNFRPLIENSLAQGFESMIVGDVKQAIYRFRGGDWSLLSSKVQRQIGSARVSENSLDTNWRSRKNIVEFNNAIFRKSVPMLAKHGPDGLDLGELARIYSDSFQKMPPNGSHKGGKVKVTFIAQPGPGEGPGGEGCKEKAKTADLAMAAMAAEIDSLLKKGVKPKKICILVRRSLEGSKCVDFLMKYQQQNEGAQRYDIISSDALSISSSLTVSVLANAMKYINDPGNAIAKAEMMRAYCQLEGIGISDDAIIKAAASSEMSDRILPGGFSGIATSFSDLPLFDLCEKIISCFGLYKHEGDSEYLRTFEDSVLSFSRTYSSDLNKFVQWWDDSGYKTNIQPSGNQDAVSVMTVHKSKGLDFSIQFIPFCSWELEETSNQHPSYIWAKCPGGTRLPQTPPLPIKYCKELGHTHFAYSYMEEKRNMAADSLNLLYVALTRAVDELHIYCPKPKEAKEIKISNAGSLLYYCIAQGQPEPGIANLADFYDSSQDTLEMCEGHSLEPGFAENAGAQLRLKPFKNSPWEDKLSILSHSSDFFIQNSPFLQDRINHGLLMHDVMSRIEYMGNAPEALQDMVYQGRITEAQRKEVSRLLGEAFEIPQVRKWFSPGWKQVITERALLTKEGSIRIPDRVLVGSSETIVIDFKFGKERDEYRGQIREYASLLESMRYPGVKAYLYYVESKKIEQVQQS